MVAEGSVGRDYIPVMSLVHYLATDGLGKACSVCIQFTYIYTHKITLQCRPNLSHSYSPFSKCWQDYMSRYRANNKRHYIVLQSRKIGICMYMLAVIFDCFTCCTYSTRPKALGVMTVDYHFPLQQLLHCQELQN